MSSNRSEQKWLDDDLKSTSRNRVLDGGDIVVALKNGIFDYMKDKIGEEAVTKFIAKIDGLQGEIDELRSSVESGE